MARSIAGAVVGLVLASGGCTQLNASHCGNQDDDRTCENRNEATPFCDKCVAANDGCVAARPSEPTCGFGETSSSSGPSEATSSTTEGTTADEADTADSSSSSGPLDPCGNGVIDEGEACDGLALPPEASCATMRFGEGVPGCVEDCTMLNYSVCRDYDECGNMAVALGEQCDGTNFGAMRSCDAFPNLTGDGLLACTSECTYDTSACMMCRESQQSCDAMDTCCEPGDVCAAVAKKCCPPGALGLCG
jgi:hypothetical protein